MEYKEIKEEMDVIYPYVDFGSDDVLYLALGPGECYIVSNIDGEKVDSEVLHTLDRILEKERNSR